MTLFNLIKMELKILDFETRNIKTETSGLELRNTEL